MFKGLIGSGFVLGVASSMTGLVVGQQSYADRMQRMRELNPNAGGCGLEAIGSVFGGLFYGFLLGAALGGIVYFLVSVLFGLNTIKYDVFKFEKPL